MKIFKTQTIKILALLALFTVATGFSVQWATKCSDQSRLEARAQKIFRYDQNHRGKLPAHHVRTLSVMMAFHNHSGAEQLINQLESQIK